MKIRIADLKRIKGISLILFFELVQPEVSDGTFRFQSAKSPNPLKSAILLSLFLISVQPIINNLTCCPNVKIP